MTPITVPAFMLLSASARAEPSPGHEQGHRRHNEINWLEKCREGGLHILDLVQTANQYQSDNPGDHEWLSVSPAPDSQRRPAYLYIGFLFGAGSFQPLQQTFNPFESRNEIR